LNTKQAADISLAFRLLEIIGTSERSTKPYPEVQAAEGSFLQNEDNSSKHDDELNSSG
jgi:hypothetical protein